MITLEPDQQRLVDGIRRSMAAGKKWVLMQAATGAGKTYMGSDIIKGAQLKNRRSMMIVPRKQLLKQSAEALRDFDIPFSYIADGHETNPFAKTFLASTLTLLKRIQAGKAPDVDLVIPDETHYGGDGLDQIIQYYKGHGSRGIGMSATPCFLNGRGMECWYDDMVCGESVEWLMAAGRLSDYRLFQPDAPDLSKLKSTDGDFKASQLNSFMKANGKLIGNSVNHYKKHAMGKLAIAYCTSVEHSEITAQRFNEAGVPSASIDGRKSDDERGKIIKAFARREILVLVNCELLTFGFDLRSASGMDVTIEAMIDLRPTESLALQMQKWGRALRKKPYPALIFDHAGNVNRHGYPDDPRNWNLKGEDSTRKFSKGGISVKNCNGGYPNRDMTGERMEPCYFSHRPSPRCPNCGAWYETSGSMIQTVSGELSEKQRPPRRAFTAEETQRLYEAIDEITKNAHRKGMPISAARKFAIGKATQQLEERIDKIENIGLQVSLHAGDKEIKI